MKGFRGLWFNHLSANCQNHKLNQTNLDLLPKITFYILELQNQKNFWTPGSEKYLTTFCDLYLRKKSLTKLESPLDRMARTFSSNYKANLNNNNNLNPIDLRFIETSRGTFPCLGEMIWNHCHLNFQLLFPILISK